MNKIFPAISVYHSVFSPFFILLIVCILSVSPLLYSLAVAQSRGRVPPSKNADQIVSDMKSRLNLTDEQEAKIRPIIEEQIKKRNVLIEKYQGQGRQGRESLRGEMQALGKSTEDQLQPILTKEQLGDYQKMQEEERQNIRKGSRGRRSSVF